MRFKSSLSCPKCQSTSRFQNLEMEEGGTELGIFLFGGLIPWGLHRSSQRNKIVCPQCGYAFTRPSNLSPGTLLRFTLLFLSVAALLAVGFYFGSK